MALLLMREWCAGVQVEVPQLTRCAGCVPLRPALVLWGALQAAAVLVITIVGLITASGQMYRGYETATLVLVLLLSLAVSAADVAAAVLLAVGARGDKPRLLNVCYQFYAVKVCGYALLLLLSAVLCSCCYSDYWYERHLDPVRYYLLMGNPAVGVLDLLFQLYLWVLVRSQVLSLGATPRFTPFRIRIQVLYADDAAEHLHDREHEHLDKHDEKAGLHCVE